MPALSAPSTTDDTYILNCIILTVSIFSAIGAGWIILSFLLFKDLRSFRHQLILGLAISDFLMAMNFLTSSSVNLGGNNIGTPKERTFCNFNGFMIQVFVIQTDYWVLTIAICTYLILAGHKHISYWIQEHKIVVWIAPWFFSVLWAVIGLAVIGYYDIGAWCWFASDRTRLLVNFIPRWIIIIVIIGLYLRLYFLIHQAHNRFVSCDEDMARTLEGTSPNHRDVPGMCFTMSSNAEDDFERQARSSTTHMTTNTNPVLKRISYQMMTYPLVYMMIWIIPTGVRIYQATTGKAAPFGLGTIDKCSIVIQGFADAIVYGFNERSLRLWKAAVQKSSPRKT